MICSYFRVIHITIKRIIIGNTQSAHDIPGTSPEGPLKVLMSGTYKGPSGDSQRTNTKIDDFMKKLFSRSNSPCITYLFLFFLQEEPLFKSSKQGRPRDVYGTQLWDVRGTKWRDVLRTSVERRSNMFSKLNSQTN